MFKKITILLILFFVFPIVAQEIKVTSGTIQHFEKFKSQYVDARNIDVWLPDGYFKDEKYAVLYMHDAQMLFDAEQTWNKQAWEIDEIAGQLITENKTQKFIVVGIWNNGQKRHQEYFPQKCYESLSQIEKDTITVKLQKAGRTTAVFKPISDSYLKFIVTELKPFIDKIFPTKTDRKNTFIAGSSMGGLISMYAICEYPKIFGGAACISTHWPGTFAAENNPIPNAFLTYLKNKLPNPKTHKLYFDCGDQTLDAMYKPIQDKVDLIITSKGYTESNWTTKFFPGKEHSENAWHERVHIPLEFLLKK